MKVNVLFNRRINADYYVMGIYCPDIARNAKPGQFVMIKTSEGSDPLLRRPFSVCRLIRSSESHPHHAPDSIEILYKVIGKGTEEMKSYREGIESDILGPFGNSFTYDGAIDTAILVSGGVGIAPLMFLAEELSSSGKDSEIILIKGARSQSDVMLVDRFTELGAQVFISTEDGSEGTQGLATELLTRYLDSLPSPYNRRCVIFSCGPKKMLNGVSKISSSHDIECQVSLEEMMACGFGVCMGCAVRIRPFPELARSPDANYVYRFTCSDGPVFNGNEVIFDE